MSDYYGAISSLPPNPQYVLSLDSLDITLLGRFIEKPKSDRKFLWSKAEIDGTSKFYQVEVILPRDDHDDFCCTLSNTYKCHICNVNVPQLYSKEHNTSEKHQIFKELTDTILENASKPTNHSLQSIGDKQHDLYFCDTCSQAVVIKRKAEHNISDNHLKAIENDNLAKEFIKMYTADVQKTYEFNENCTVSPPDDELDENDNLNDNNNGLYVINRNICDIDKLLAENKKASFKLKTDKTRTTINEVNNEAKCVAGSLEQDENIVKINDKSNTSSIKTEEENRLNNLNSIETDSTDKIKEFEIYLQNTLISYSGYMRVNFNLLVLDDSIVVITPNGNKNTITVDNFHSYKRIHGTVFCQLCQVYICQDRIHSGTEDHIKGVTKPLNNYFAREVNQVWSHCLLCNERITTGLNHAKLNTYHLSQLDNPDLTNCTDTTDITFKRVYCYACNINIPSFNAKAHLQCQKSIDNFFECDREESNKNLPKLDWLHKTGKRYSKFKYDYEYSYSNFGMKNSEINVASNDLATGVQSSEFEHGALFHSDLEKKVYGSKLEFPNGTSNVEFGIEYSDFKYNSESSNYESIDDNYLKLSGKLHFYRKQITYLNKSFAECETCEIIMANDNSTIIEHSETRCHKINVSKLLSMNRIKMASKSPLFYCDFCDEIIESFIKHIKDFNHKGWTRLRKLLPMERLNRYVYPGCQGYYGRESYRKLYEKLLTDNKVITQFETSYCEVCRVSIPKFSEISHIEGKKHGSNMFRRLGNRF